MKRKIRLLAIGALLIGSMVVPMPAQASHSGVCSFSTNGPSTDNTNIYGSSHLNCGGTGHQASYVEVEIWEDDTFPDSDDLKSQASNSVNGTSSSVYDSWNCNGTGLQTYYLKGFGNDTSGRNYSVTTGTQNLNC